MTLARLLVLSSADAEGLDTAASTLGAALADQPSLPIDELAVSLAGREVGPHRLAVVAESSAAAAESLLGGHGCRGNAATPTESVVFLLPGVGDHWPGMVAGLYESVPSFRSALDECAEVARHEAGVDLLRAVVEPGEPPAEPVSPLRSPDRPPWLDEPRTAQPAVFAVEYALAQVLRGVGIEPAALLGYSIGEYVAAALAAVLPVPDLVRLVTRRALLIETTPPGGMLVVMLGADALAPYLERLGDPDLVVGAVDGPRLCVLSGPAATVDKAACLLDDDLVATRRLPVRHAFHSPLLDEVAGPLSELAAGFRPRPPAIPVLSNVSGGWLTEAESTGAGYWARHMCRPVLFADDLAELWRLPSPLLLEVGPGRMLGSLAFSHPGRPPARPALATLPTPARPGTDRAGVLDAVGRAWVAGVPVDLARATAL